MKSYLDYKKYIIAFVICLAGAAWIWISRVPAEGQPLPSLTAPQEGFQAPPFSLTSNSDDEFNLADYRGVPIIINFWASWCPPCKAEMPAFQQLFEEHQSTNLIIAAVNVTNQDSLSEAREFITLNQLTLPILFDISGSTSHAYNINLLPSTFFINRKGNIQKIIIGGPIPISLLRVELDKLLQEEP